MSLLSPGSRWHRGHPALAAPDVPQDQPRGFRSRSRLLSGRIPALLGRGWGRAVPSGPGACPVSPRAALALSQCRGHVAGPAPWARADVTGTRRCHLTPGLVLLTQPGVPRAPRRDGAAAKARQIPWIQGSGTPKAAGFAPGGSELSPSPPGAELKVPVPPPIPHLGCRNTNLSSLGWNILKFSQYFPEEPGFGGP